MVEAIDIKKFVNEIFTKKGLPPVKNFADEFSDGSKTFTFPIQISNPVYSQIPIAF
jgi:hypothetical protein